MTKTLSSRILLAFITASLLSRAFAVSDPNTADPYKYSRFGDFKSAQLRSTTTHGYGLYFSEMQMSPSPTVSTFWLYGDSPSASYMQDVTQLWRWNEIDFEFVPYTHSVQPQYMTFTWNGDQPITDLTYFGAELELSSILFSMPNSDTADYTGWVQGLIRTDNVVAQQNMNSAAMGLTYTDGPPTGGTFQIVVESGGTKVTTSDLAYNASVSDVSTALMSMSNSEPFLNSLLPSGFVVNSPGPAGGACGVDASTTITLPSGLTPQISPGDIVTQPSGTAVIAANTVVQSVNRTNNTAVIAPAATGTNSSVTLNFTHPSSWVITFNGGTALGTDEMPNIYIDRTNLIPAGTTLAKITPGLNSSQEATGMTVTLFQTPLQPASEQSWVDYLAANTGAGEIYPSASAWKYPFATAESPENLPISRMGSTNFWRAIDGYQSVSIDIPTYGTFDRKGVYNGPLGGATNPDYYTSAVFNNEAFYWDTTEVYDPYTAIYTYVIVWTPTRLAQYVLPKLDWSGGMPQIDFEDLTPIVDFDLTEYPTLAQSGPQADPTTDGTSGGATVDGGTVPFAYTELNEQIDDVSLNLANYVGYVQTPSGFNGSATVSASVTAGSKTINNVNSFTGTVTSAKANPIVILEGLGSNTPQSGMFITADNTTLVPPTTQISNVWENAYMVTLSVAAKSSGTGQFTFTGSTGSFSLSGTVIAGQTDLILPSLSGNTITAGMTVTATPTSLLPAGAITVAAFDDTASTYAQLSQSPSDTGTGPCYLFNLVTTSEGDTVSWFPQPKQIVTGTGIPDQTIITSVSANGTTVTLQIPGSATPTQNISSITLASPTAGSGWSGPPPGRNMPDEAAYVRSIGFFELKDMSSDGSKMSDFNIVAPASTNDNFLINFNDTSTWTQSNWQSKLTRYFNILYTPNPTHLGAQPGTTTSASLQYPNLSPANVSLTTLDSDQVLALHVGANDLTLNTAGDNWQTPPNTNFYQVSANPPAGQVSSDPKNQLLRVQVNQVGNEDLYWTANSPVLGASFIYAPPVGTKVQLEVKVWALDSGTVPMGQPLPEPNAVAVLELSNSATTGPTFKVVSDPNKIIATTPGSIIQVQLPSALEFKLPSWLTDLFGFHLIPQALTYYRDEHPKGRGTIHYDPLDPWYDSPQFGLVYGGSLPWVYSQEFETWVYPNIDGDNLWLWTDEFGWCWSNMFPWAYSTGFGGWIYVDSSGFAYDQNTSQWFELDDEE